jgi:hypothetical protein
MAGSVHDEQTPLKTRQPTATLLLTMADGRGRPLLQALPQGQPSFTLAGSPINIAS